MRKYAQHVIFWRRAIAIPPLHARDIYILSPNCNVSRLPQAVAQWARQFPLAPALPNFLADLSVAPRPYKMHCPAKPHRPLYMAMLAWLMRGGWVTQLCTFGYVVVWPEIIYEVEYALEAQAIAKAKRTQGQGAEPASIESTNTISSFSTGGGEGASLSASVSPTHSASSAERSLDASTDLGSSTATLRGPSLSSTHVDIPGAAEQQSPGSEASSPSPRSPLRPGRQQRPSEDDDDDVDNDVDDSGDDNDNNNNNNNNQAPPRHRRRQRTQRTPAEQAAEKARLERIADKAARDLADRATAHARKAAPRQTAHPSVNDAPHLAALSPHVILDAKKATGRESLYLDAIGRRLLSAGRVGASAVGRRRTDGNGNGNGNAEGGEGQDGSGKGEAAAADGGDNNNNTNTNNNNKGDRKVSEDGEKRAGPAKGAPSTPSRLARDGIVRDGRDWDEGVAAAWPRFWKYFNGRSALERVALQEDMKRKDVWNLLTAMSEYLLCVRHW